MRNSKQGALCLPILNPVHWWTFDEENSSDNARDIIGSEPLVQGGSPLASVKGWAGGSRRTSVAGNDTFQGATLGADAAAMVANSWSVGVAFTLRALPAAQQSIMTYACPNAGTSATNHLLVLRMSSAGEVGLTWQGGSNVTYTAPATGLFLVPGKQTILTVDRISSTQLRFSINGGAGVTVTMPGANSGGDQCRWRICTNTLGSAVLDADLHFAWVCASASSQADRIKMWRMAQGLGCNTTSESRVRIENASGSMVNMCDFLGTETGIDFVERVSGRFGVDDAVEVCEIELTRDIEDISLAPWDTYSAARLDTSGASIGAVVAQGRDVIVDMARTPLFMPPEIDDYVRRFEGQVDSVDSASSPMKVTCRDIANYVVDDVMETDTKIPLTGSLNTGGCGTTAAPLETAISNLLSLMHETAPTFTARTPANLCVIQQEIERGPFMEAIRKLAALKGWDVKTMFNEINEVFELTLIDPGRDRLDVDGAILDEDVFGASQVGLNRIDVRNRIRGSALANPSVDAEGSDEEGEGVLITRTVEDAASQLEYRIRFMDISMGSSAFIRGESNLLKFLNAILSDVAYPTVAASFDMGDLWELELFDILHVAVGALPLTFGSTSFNLAVTDLQWSDDANGIAVGAGMRSKPSTGALRALSFETRPTLPEPARPPLIDIGQPLLGRLPVDRLLPLRSVIARPIFHGGRSASILNGSFATWSGGPRQAPDGWVVDAGAMVTDIARTPTYVRSGNLAVQFNNTTGVLKSSWIPVNEGLPYTVDLDWLIVSGDDLARVDIQWFDLNRSLVSTTTLYAGSGFDSVTVSTLTWFKSRAEGVQAPATARFARVLLRQQLVGGAAGVVVVDRVNLTRTAIELRLLATSGTPTFGPTTGRLKAEAAAIASYAVDTGSETLKRPSGCYLSSTGSPYHGYGFLCLEDMTVDVTALAHWIVTSGTSVARRAKIQLRLNAVYDVNGIITTAGTILAEAGINETFTTTPLYPAHMCAKLDYPGLKLKTDDRLTVSYVCDEGDAARIRVYQGPANHKAFFHVRQRFAD